MMPQTYETRSAASSIGISALDAPMSGVSPVPTVQQPAAPVPEQHILGLMKLRANKKFTSPTACDAALKSYRGQCNPVQAFVEYRCMVVANAYVPKSALYAAYGTWCKENGQGKATHPVFGRELHRLVPALKDARPSDASGGRSSVYSGLTLKDSGGAPWQ